MRRRLILYVLAVPAGLLLAALALLVAFRVSVLEAVLERELAARGLAEARLEVEAVGLERARLADFALDDQGSLTARRIDVRYSLAGLRRGELRHVTATGLRLALDLTGPEPPLAPLRPLLAGGGAGAALPQTALRDVVVRAATPRGPVVARLDGAVLPDPGGGHARAEGTLEALAGRLSGSFRVTLAPLQGASRLALDKVELRLRTPISVLAADLQGEVAPQDGGGTASLRGTLSSGDDRLSGNFRMTAAPLSGEPLIALREAQLRVATPAGPITAELRADVSPGRDGGRASLRGRLASPDGSLTAELQATAAPLSPAAELRLHVDGAADATAPLWTALRLPEPAAGALTLGLDARGKLPDKLPDALPAAEPAAALHSLFSTGLVAEAELALSDVDYPGAVERLAARAPLALAVREEALVLRLAAPAEATAAAVDRDALADLELPPALAELLAGLRRAELAPWSEDGELLRLQPGKEAIAARGRASVRLGFAAGKAELSAAGEATWIGGAGPSYLALDSLDLQAEDIAVRGQRLRRANLTGWLEGPPPALDGELDLRLQVAEAVAGGLRLGDLRLEAPLALTTQANGAASVELRAPGRLSLAQASPLGPLHLAAPLRAQLADGRVARADDGAFSYALTAEPEETLLEVLPEGAPPLEARFAPGRVRLQGQASARGAHGLRVELAGAGARAPALDLAAEGAEAELNLGTADEPLARLALGRLRSTAVPAPFAPLTGHLQVERRDGRLAASGELGPAGTELRASLAGEHDPRSGRGVLRIDLPEVGLAPEGLQPRDLSPLLAAVRRAEGTVTGEAQIAWTGEGLESRGALVLDALAFETARARVQGLSGRLAFDRLLPPPSTPPAQELTAARVEAGMPLTDARVRFSLESADEGPLPTLRIERAETGFAGGRLRLGDVRLTPGAPRQELTLRVEGLDLAALFEQLAVEGLSGSGRMSGRIPVSVEAGAVAIRSGRLEAAGDGVLRYRSEAAERALAGGGEYVTLMLRALRDFRYQELTVTLDRSPAGDIELGISMLGHNPDVLEGHPFRINVTLTGDVEPLLRALAEGRRLSGELLQRMLELQR